MKIPLQEALDLIESADIVKLTNGDHFYLPHISIDGINNDPLNEVMIVTWDEEGYDYAFKVTEGENTEVERDGHKLTMIDDSGEPFELQLFREVPISLPLQEYLK